MKEQNRKKTIAIIHGPLVFGGAEKALINMLHYFDYSKYDVTLWLKDGSGEMQEQVDPGVHIKYWEAELEKSFSAYVKSLIGHGKLLRAAKSLFYRLLSRIFVRDWHRNFKYHIKSVSPFSDEDYDAAISYHSLVRDDVMILSYAFNSRKKIGWIHGAGKHEPQKPYFKPFRIEYPKLDRVFCVSKSVEQVFLSKYPIMEGKTSVMYNLQRFSDIRTLALETTDIDFEKLTFVTVGRLAQEKGQIMIPRIAQALLSKGYCFKWLLIGDGPEKKGIEELVDQLGLGDTVLLLGAKRNPYPYIKNCTLYVQTSFSEGYCVTTFEAKILNKPVVTTDVCGMREQFRDGEAIFCSPDVESLSQGIMEALKLLPELTKQDNDFNDSYNYTELDKLYRAIEG